MWIKDLNVGAKIIRLLGEHVEERFVTLVLAMFSWMQQQSIATKEKKNRLTELYQNQNLFFVIKTNHHLSMNISQF